MSPPAHARPLEQGAVTQLPAWHTSPAGQASPQVPQFCVSDWRSTQETPPQHTSPNEQLVWPQDPELPPLDDPPEELLEEPPEEPPLEPPPQLWQTQTGQHSWGAAVNVQGASQGSAGHSQIPTGWQAPLSQVSSSPHSALLVQAPQACPQFGSQLPGPSSAPAPKPPSQAVAVKLQ